MAVHRSSEPGAVVMTAAAMDGWRDDRVFEVRQLETVFSSPRDEGAGVIITGDPGMGKTSMAIEARSLAQANGMTVVAIAGAQEERGLPFAGLHQILRPWLADLDGLPGTRRDALRAASRRPKWMNRNSS